MIGKSNSRILFVFDLAIIYACFLAAYLYYTDSATLSLKASLLMAFVGVFWFLISINSNILNINTQSRYVEVLRNALVAYSVLSAGVIASVAVFGNFRYSDKLILYPLLFSCVLSSFFRFFFLLTIRHFVRNGYQQKAVLVIGGGRVAENVMEEILSTPELGYRIHGMLADSYHESLPKGLYLGKIERFSEIVRSRLVDEVIIALPMKMEETIVCMVQKCEHEGVRVRIVPDLYRISRSRVTLDELGTIPLISVRTEPLSLLRNRIVKRAFDVAFSFTALVLLSPILFLLSLIITLTSRGPVLFKQQRIGINNDRFMMYKFRTMIVQREEESDTIWTTADDERVTRIGKFMRKTNLDELPQFWNVLTGDMSVVGPRPEREHFVEQFKNDIPHYKVRHLVKSGITGLAQVNGWRGDTSIEKRVEQDIHYLENWSLWMDIKIIGLTVFGRQTNKHAY